MWNIFLEIWTGGFDALPSEGMFGIFLHADWIVFLFVILFSYRMFVLNKEIVRLKDGNTNKLQEEITDSKRQISYLTTGSVSGLSDRAIKLAFITPVIGGVLALIVMVIAHYL